MLPSSHQPDAITIISSSISHFFLYQWLSSSSASSKLNKNLTTLPATFNRKKKKNTRKNTARSHARMWVSVNQDKRRSTLRANLSHNYLLQHGWCKEAKIHGVCTCYWALEGRLLVKKGGPSRCTPEHTPQSKNLVSGKNSIPVSGIQSNTKKNRGWEWIYYKKWNQKPVPSGHNTSIKV